MERRTQGGEENVEIEAVLVVVQPRRRLDVPVGAARRLAGRRRPALRAGGGRPVGQPDTFPGAGRHRRHEAQSVDGRRGERHAQELLDGVQSAGACGQRLDDAAQLTVVRGHDARARRRRRRRRPNQHQQRHQQQLQRQPRPHRRAHHHAALRFGDVPPSADVDRHRVDRRALSIPRKAISFFISFQIRKVFLPGVDSVRRTVIVSPRLVRC